MKTTKYILVIFMFLSLSVPSFAQMENLGKPGIGFGPQVGYYKAKDADKGTFMYGLALRARITPLLGIEGSINYRQEKYGDGAVTVRSWPLLVTGMIYPLPIVYGAVGAGWYNTSYDYTVEEIDTPGDIPNVDLSDETRQEFGYHFGAGIELPLGSSSRLTGDVKYVFLNHNFKQAAQTALEEDADGNFYVISVGLLFGF